MEIQKLNLFRGISQEEIEDMLRCASTSKKKYKEGEYLFRVHDKPVFMFVILSGRAIVARDFSSGRQDIILEVAEGDVLGENFFDPDNKEYWYDAIAGSDTEVLMLPFSFFYGFCGNACKKHQELIKNMLEIFSVRNSELSKKAHILSCNNLRERIALWLLDNCNESGKVVLNMNREQLSSYLGVTRPSLSRELMKMQDDGLIKADKGWIKIINGEKLENYI